MTRSSIVGVACFLTGITAITAQTPAERWWSHVTFLADDRLAGRETGTDGYRRAADYVVEQFSRLQLQPGTGNSYRQPVAFRWQRIVESQSRLELVREGRVEQLALGEAAMLNARSGTAPALEGSLVFVGYGLVIPELKHDDLAASDLRGRVAVYLTGAPASVPGPLSAHYQNARWEALRRAGAIGVIAIQNPKGQDIPWERQMVNRFLPSLALADEALDTAAGQQLSVTFNPARAEALLAGSGYRFSEILDLANSEKPLPHMPLPSRIRTAVAVERRTVTSDNVVGVMPGTDPALRDQVVVVSAHLDHLGTGVPVDGDAIFNGAMDNASGIATLIETAAALTAAKPKRTIAFVAVTAEENGLLGSRYFARHPAISGRIVANLNTDMFLPLFPLTSIVAQGLEESDLAADLRDVGVRFGIKVLSDPEPERRAFVRSDQYSFIQTGTPALSLKVGFESQSREHEIVRRWRAERYHSVRDDLSQPVDLQAATDFNAVYAALVEAVANRQTVPTWNADTFFKRYARETVAGRD
jgi:hypothetical protein